MCEPNLFDDLREFERKFEALGCKPFDMSERLFVMLRNRLCADPSHPSLKAEEERVTTSFAAFSKDATRAESFRRKGNEHFRKKEYDAAICYYNQAIVVAPWDSHVFALALGNRGVCFMADPKTALNGIYDAKTALTLNYPEQEQHKLYLRVGSAYMDIFSFKEAFDAFEIALEKTLALPESGRELFRRKCEDLIEQAAFGMESSGEEHEDDELGTEEEKSRRDGVIMFSHEQETGNAVEGWKDVSRPGWLMSTVETLAQIARTDGNVFLTNGGTSGSRGKVCVSTRSDQRKVVASTDLFIGQEVLTEYPLHFVLNRQHIGKRCAHCLANLAFPRARIFPCYSCSLIKYCCPKCQEADWMTHYHVCKILPALMSEKYFGEILAIVAAAIVSRPLGGWESFLNEPRNRHWASPFCKCDACWTKAVANAGDSENCIVQESPSGFMDLYSLELPVKRGSCETGRIAEVAEGFLKTLMTTEYWKSGVKSVGNVTDTFVGMAELIFRLISNVVAYSFNVYNLCYTDPELYLAERIGVGCKCGMKCVGLAMYPFLGRVRHDCQPNTVLAFFGKVAVLKALRPIGKGGEITVSFALPYYLDWHCDHRRSDTLFAKFSRKCPCVACNSPLWIYDLVPEEDRLLCKCKMPLETVDVLEKEAKRLKNGGTCPACGRKYNKVLQAYLKERKKFYKRDDREILSAMLDARSGGKLNLRKGKLVKEQAPADARREIINHFEFLAEHVLEPSRHMGNVSRILHLYLCYEVLYDHAMRTKTKLWLPSLWMQKLQRARCTWNREGLDADRTGAGVPDAEKDTDGGDGPGKAGGDSVSRPDVVHADA